jgi:hypothetical protein
VGEPGMKIAGATLSNIADGKLEELFQELLAKVVESFSESSAGDIYEVNAAKEITAKIRLDVHFSMNVESRATDVAVTAGFTEPKRKTFVRAAFVRAGGVLVEETRQEDLPLPGSKVSPIRGGGEK